MPASITIKVRGFHLDIYGHVNNARYLEFMEDARWEYFQGHVDLGEWRAQHGHVWVIVNININYRRPANFGEVLTVSAAISRLGNRSVVMHQEIRLQDGGELVAEADVTFAVADEKTGRAIILEGELRGLLEGLMARDQA